MSEQCGHEDSFEVGCKPCLDECYRQLNNAEKKHPDLTALKVRAEAAERENAALKETLRVLALGPLYEAVWATGFRPDDRAWTPVEQEALAFALSVAVREEPKEKA